jgi:lysophospholipase L1-like esterase
MATDNRAYTELPTGVAPDVPLYVNGALREIDVDVQSIEDKINAWDPGAAFVGERLPAGQDLNALITPGVYGVWSAADAATMTNLPPNYQGGPITVTRFGQQVYQDVERYANDRARWHRQGTEAGAFFGWDRTDLGSLVIPVLPVISKVPKSGFKNVALALNVSETAGTEANLEAAVRFPLNFGFDFKRARLHIRNWSYVASAAGTVYAGAVSFTGAWTGPAVAGNQFSGAPLNVLPAFTTPADGSEYVSPWFDLDYKQGAAHLFAFGYTTPGGHVQARARGGCWRTTLAADAPLGSGFTGGYSIYSPFDVWLEAEVPGEVPVIAAIGDSNTAATGTFFPVSDSWLSQLCRTALAVPYFVAAHGTTADTWDTPTDARWNRFGPEIAKPDLAIHFLGRNNLQPGVNLEAMQTAFRNVAAVIRDKLTPNLYAGTLTPSNTEAVEVQTLRRAYNAWLKTKPEGLHDVYDFVAAVSDDDATIRAADNADGLHFKITGHAQIAAKVAERPVVPARLTQKEIAKLKTLAV